MDCRVDDGQVITVKYVIVCDLSALPDEFSWSTDDRGVRAFSDDDRDAIMVDLDELKLPYTVEPVDQPDPSHLAQIQGHVSSRSEALAALDALSKGDTPDILSLRLRRLETDVADLKSAQVPKA